jgi:hypothetical protein
VAKLGPLERLTTIDGELAAVVTVTGNERGQQVQRDLGFVVTDDFYSSAACTCRVQAHAGESSSILRNLVRQDVHALGIRRRRYEYEPPPGWQPLAQSLSVEWLPPDYPRYATTILIYPANPIGLYGRADLARAPQELAQLGYEVRVSASREITTPTGLHGALQELAFEKAGESALRTQVLLRDDHYCYPAEVTSRTLDRWAEANDVFLRLVNSIIKIPSWFQVPSATPVLLHWAD